MNLDTPIQAVIFDRDGVLTDFDMVAGERFFGPRVPLSLWDIFLRWETLGQTIGFPSSVAEEVHFFRRFWDAISDECGLDAATRQELHDFDYTTCLQVFADARPALMACRAAGLRTGVLSNFALASLAQSLQATGLASWIDVACAATVIGAAKPDARAYLTTAAQLGVAPQQCLFFDDELPCVEGARRVGMHAFWVDRTRRDHDLDAGIVADLGALTQLIQE